MTSKTRLIATTGILVPALLLSAIPVSAQVWSNPTSAPTAGNASTPLNVSTLTQTKSGVLNVSGLRSYVDAIVDGRIGIGNTSPATKLSVSGNVFLGNVDAEQGFGLTFRGRSDLGLTESGYSMLLQAPEGVVINIDSNGNTTATPFQVRENGTGITGGNALLTVQEGGNVGIGVTGPSYKLQVGGSVGATSFFYTSDESLKNGIRPLEGSLSKILRLQGVSFSWKEDGKESVGLVAQDVEKVYPELVHSTAEGIKSVEYGNLVAPLIEAVKEQQREIDVLKAELRSLKESR